MVSRVVVAAFVALCAAAAVVRADDDAYLLASKEIVSVPAVDRELIVKYALFNIGDTAATDVVLEDTSFEEGYTHVLGFTTVKWPRIAPGANVTHTLVYTPHAPGKTAFTAAKVSYFSDAESQQTTWTSSPPPATVLEAEDFSRQYDANLLYWLAFLLLASLPILGPYVMLK